MSKPKKPRRKPRSVWAREYPGGVDGLTLFVRLRDAVRLRDVYPGPLVEFREVLKPVRKGGRRGK